MKRVFLTALMFLMLTALSAQITPVALGTTYSGNTIKVLLLADGYTSAQMPTFLAKAALVKSAIMSNAPYSSNTTKFNFYTVSTPSVQSGYSQLAGTDDNGNPQAAITKNTYWGCYVNNKDLDRYYGMPTAKRALLESYYGNFDSGEKVFAIVISNNTGYAGYGDLASFPTWNTNDVSMLITSVDPVYLAYLVLHEFGHSFGDLDDEYVDAQFASSGDPVLSHPNRLNVFDTGDQPSGWLEGARYVATGKWRYGNAIMRGSSWTHHSYNQTLIQKRITFETTNSKSIQMARFSSSSNSGACNQSFTGSRTRYHRGAGSIPFEGDMVFMDADCRIPMEGHGDYWRFGTSSNSESFKMDDVGRLSDGYYCSGGGGGGGFPK